MTFLRRIASVGRRTPWGLMGMVALVVLAEWFVSHRAMSFYDVDEWAYRWTSRKASRSVKSCELLCMGDSLVKLSVVPKIIEAEIKKPVFSLALSGSQPPATYFMLRRVLASGARPKAILVDFNPPLIRIGPRLNVARYPVFLNSIETALLASWARDPDLFGEITARQILPSLRAKSTIRAQIFDALGGKSLPNPFWNSLAIRNWQVNRGAQLMAGSAAVQNLSDADVARIEFEFNPNWNLDPANLIGIDRFLALARESQIQIYWLLMPQLPAFQDQMVRTGMAARHEQLVRSWQAKYPEIVVLDGRRKMTDLDGFWDSQHLSVAGASGFSRILGEVLKGLMTDPKPTDPRHRWVNLPPMEPGPVGPGLETDVQSHAMVQAKPKKFR